MAFEAGSIVARVKADVTQFKQGMAEAKTSTSVLKDHIGRVGDGAMQLSKILTGVGVVAGTLVATGMYKASKASWEQVDAVQQATLALKAYEKNGDAVNDVLKNLIAYARSDMGVLFNRKDLFEAAQSLKIMGDNTASLTDHVKIMSRSVGLGLSTWDDLNRIVGRVGSTGRLAGDDFDNLTKAGYKLDPALRNTKISWDELFKALDKGIPVDALAGQANTIKGLSIRLETAFRGIGDAILGVDSNTSQFIEGGLGDQLVGFVKDLTKWLGSPEVKDGFKKLGEDIAKAGQFIKDNTQFFKDLAIVIGVTMVGAIVAVGVAWATSPIGEAALIIGLIVGGVLAVVEHFGGWKKVMEDMQPTIQWFKDTWTKIVDYWNVYLKPIVDEIYNKFKNDLYPALQELWQKHGPEIIKALQLMAIAFLVVVGVLVGSFLAGVLVTIQLWSWAVQAITTGIDFIKWNINGFKLVWHSLGDAIRIQVAQIVGVVKAMVNGIRIALSSVISAITWPFTQAFDIVKKGVQEVVNKLKDLNPFMRHSPSLVDLVTRGTAEITKQYTNMFDSIGELSNGANIPAMSGDLGVGGNSTNVNSRTVIGSVNLQSPQAVDEFFNKMNRSDALTSMGLTGGTQ